MTLDKIFEELNIHPDWEFCRCDWCKSWRQKKKQAIQAVKDRVREQGVSEGEIIDKIINSKIVNHAKKSGEYIARLQRREYDDPEDKWLKDKSTELGKAIHTEMDKAMEGL